jgi:glycosyltransferase involved in cell wall biosynthesis
LSDKTPGILIMGPMPPPYGGVASIVSILSKARFEDLSVHIVETTIHTRNLVGRLAHGAKIFFRLLISILRYQPDGLLSFCGAYASFWEKGLWAGVAHLFGVRTAIVMVDGNFPAFEKELGAIRRRAMRRIFKMCDVIAVQSAGWHSYYQPLSGHDRFSRVVGGVDQRTFKPAPSRKMTEVVTILFVGWLIAEKGIYELLEAALLLSKAGLKFQIRLVGPLFDQKRFNSALETASLGERVVPLGILPQPARLVAEYQKSDIFVLPSHAEGFPNAVLEAMAVGLPVVATSVGGLPEIIESGVSGMLVPPHDASQLAVALSSLIKDPAHRRRIGEAARQRILQRFTLEHSLASYANIFGHLHQAQKKRLVRSQTLKDEV